MKIKKIVEHIFLCTLTLISPKLNTKYYYKKRIGKKINLDNPNTFNEKIQWLKLNVFSKERKYSDCADKYKVREYVKKCGCEEILVDLIDVYDDPSEIDFDKLPNKFVLKWNFGSGLNIICDNKKVLNEIQIKKKLKRWKRKKFYLKTSEMHYKYIDKKILCEKFLTNDIKDYKFYCYNGDVECVMVCFQRINGYAKTYYFDKEWNLLKDYSLDSIEGKDIFEIEKPKLLKKMFDYASVLSKGFPFVRVDLYYVNNNIYFGELTFTPYAGLDKTKELLPQQMADKIKIK